MLTGDREIIRGPLLDAKWKHANNVTETHQCSKGHWYDMLLQIFDCISLICFLIAIESRQQTGYILSLIEKQIFALEKGDMLHMYIDI